MFVLDQKTTSDLFIITPKMSKDNLVIELGRISIVLTSLVCSVLVAVYKPDAFSVFSTITVGCIGGYYGVSNQTKQ